MQGHLQIAELWFEEQQPDSAIAAILRTPRNQSSELLRAYVVSRGRQLLRGASDTATTVWQRAIVLFALADSLDSQDDSRSLLVAATLSLARAELVLGIPAKSCPAAERSNRALALSADALDRGAGGGDGGDNSSMRETFTALRLAVENAMRVYCPPPPSS
jgi:hypothetical protein